MNAVATLLKPPPVLRERNRFTRLRRSLAQQGVGCVRLIYAALEGDCFVTITASPSPPRRLLDGLDPSITSAIYTAFRRWIRRAHPDWGCGLDCTGIIDWDLDRGRLAHRHSGYELRWCHRLHRHPPV